MADHQPEKDKYKVSERKRRIVTYVPIRITEITPESVADCFTSDETGEGLPWEWA
jgi:hypothetical protein